MIYIIRDEISDHEHIMHHKHTILKGPGCQLFCQCPGLFGHGALPKMCPSQNSGSQNEETYLANTHNLDILR